MSDMQIIYDPGGGITLVDLSRGGCVTYDWAHVLLLSRLASNEESWSWFRTSLVSAGASSAERPASAHGAQNAKADDSSKCDHCEMLRRDLLMACDRIFRAHEIFARMAERKTQ